MKVSTWLLKVKDLASNALTKVEAKGAKAFSSFEKASDGVNRWMRKVKVQSHKTEKGIDRIRSSISGLFPGLGTLRTLALGAFAAFSIQSAISGVIRFGSEAQKAKLSYEVMLGSVEKGNALYEQLQGFANKTPFSNAAVNKAAQTLLQFGTAGADILPTLQMIGDVSAGDKQKFESLSLAFGQMSSAGKLMGQDLLQMINAGFNPLQEISKMTGKSMGVLKEEMAKGAISSQMVIQAFRSATGEGGQFNGMMERMSETFSGKWSTALGKIQVLAIQIFERIEPALMSFMNTAITGIDYLIVNLSNVLPIIKAVGAAVGVLALGFGLWKIQMLGALVVTKLVTAAQWAWNLAMNANPIGIVITAIAAFVGWLVYLYNTNARVRGAIKGLWEAFKAVFMGMKKMAGEILGGIGDLLLGVFTLDASKISSGIMRLKSSYKQLALDASKAFVGGFNTGVSELKVKALSTDKSKDPASVLGKSSFDTEGGSSLESGLENISGGGKSVKNVTVQIENFGTGTILQIQGPEDVDTDDLERRWMEKLSRIINGGMLAAG